MQSDSCIQRERGRTEQSQLLLRCEEVGFRVEMRPARPLVSLSCCHCPCSARGRVGRQIAVLLRHGSATMATGEPRRRNNPRGDPPNSSLSEKKGPLMPRRVRREGQHQLKAQPSEPLHFRVHSLTTWDRAGVDLRGAT